MPELDLTGWVKLLDWGYNAEVYERGNDRVMIDRERGNDRVMIDRERGNDRVMIDRETGRVIIRYTFREGGDSIGEDGLEYSASKK